MTECLFPNLPQPATIVMDNASYHSRKLNKLPPKSAKKATIAKWLDDNHVDHGPVELYNLATSNYPGDRYAVEEMAAAHGHSILRLSPYHCVFNPIEKIWSILKPKVREKNTQYTATSCKALIEEAASQISRGL